MSAFHLGGVYTVPPRDVIYPDQAVMTSATPFSVTCGTTQLQWSLVSAMQVNKIRQSLRLVARNSTAFGLHQPHMERTKLCELGDDQLDSKYIQQRSSLRELVQQLAKPKRVNGKVMTGPALAELVSQMVTALNARDIPTAGSILEHFNKELVYR